jgi:hypothetical protein
MFSTKAETSKPDVSDAMSATSSAKVLVPRMRREVTTRPLKAVQ